MDKMRIVHCQNHPDETSSIILPTNLEQTKALGKLKSPKMQWEVWKKSVEVANGKIPSASDVKKIIEEYFSEPIPKDWQMDDVFILKELKGEKKKYNGSYCFAKELKDRTVTVESQNSTLTVNSNHLKKIDLPNAKQQLQQNWERLERIQENVELRKEPKVAELVERIGKQITFSSLEENILTCIEKYCEVTESESEL
ncbi:hypothetical protein C7B79_22675 [Chroococcidiopsis cubana CCALA 043]|nr:hypothetical protein C7B79_22675 [Chroococcidiopsis cubana CCALA 043]